MAEVVAPPSLRDPARSLMAALAGQGVTATCALPDGPRYGYQELDSNLPDFRICLGGPDDNELTARVLAAAGPTQPPPSTPGWRTAASRGSGCRLIAVGPMPSGRAPTCAARWTCRS